MKQHTFTTHPNNALEKIAQLKKEGWTIIAIANTSTPETEADAHGVSYGGASFSILAEREYEKPNILYSSNHHMCSRPCNPPMPGGKL